jgi:hypothetical protein
MNIGTVDSYCVLRSGVDQSKYRVVSCVLVCFIQVIEEVIAKEAILDIVSVLINSVIKLRNHMSVVVRFFSIDLY